MAAPTEAEIREIIEDYGSTRRFANSETLDDLIDRAVDRAFDAILQADLDKDGDLDFGGEGPAGDVWTDLRPSEAQFLGAFIVRMKARVHGIVHEAIVGGAVETALEFAAMHPDAKRAEVLQPA
jgi:hypothetical protein